MERMVNERAGQTVRPSAFDALEPPETEAYLDCIHCGFCLPVCPTYLTLENEMDSPRGRIYLIRAAAEGRIGLNATFAKHMDRCLVCRACETACPSGVTFGALMEAARGQLRRRYTAPPAQRWLRDTILAIVTDAGRLERVTRLLAVYQRSGLQALVRASGLLKLAGPLAAMEALLPRLHDWGRQSRLPETTPARGRRRGRVGMLTGCVQRVWLPRINRATATVLAENGYEVVAPDGQGCCGSLLVHEGERERARARARVVIDLFERAQVEIVVANAAGCGSAMKGYGELLRGDPDYAPRAEAFARSVRDVSQLLATGSLNGRLGRLAVKVTYHEPCHLAHAQRIRAEPRALIRAIPGVQFVELKESDVCCGSAGIYNLLHPGEAGALLERKLERVAESGAEIVLTGNPGCLMQLEAGLRRRGMTVAVMHPVELLARAYEVGAGSAPGLQ